MIMNAKKLFFFVLGMFLFANLMAFEHGSMKGNDLPIYPQRDGGAPGTAVSDVTFDFKLVTVGTKTWVWTDWHGKTIAGNAWSSQYRYWPGKIENNLTGRIAETQQTHGTVTALPSANPATITFLQEENNAFFETDDMVYDYTAQNSKDDTDDTAPVLNAPDVNLSSLALELVLSATDNSGDYFYYIVDEANNFTEVSFFDNIKLTLAPETSYNFSIYAVDFSGNMSDVQVVTTEQVQAVYMTEGIAQKLSFKLDSRSLTQLVIECTSEESIGDAFVKLEINGNAIADKEWKPTIDQAVGTTTYRIIVPSSEVPGWGENVILGLNLGYITMPIGNWGHYVLENKTITSGENEGLPILHKIGTGTDIEEIVSGQSDVKSDNITISQSQEQITIHAVRPIERINLYTLSGRSIPVILESNTIVTSSLSSGLYILQVTDAIGVQRSLKVVIR
jgi:hypothetical protein